MKKRIFILLFTLFLLCGALLISSYERLSSTASPTEAVSFVVTSNGSSKAISLWSEDEETYYVFLPSYADLSQVKARLKSRNAVHVDGCLLTDQTTCDRFDLNTPYTFTLDSQPDAELTLEFIRSDNVSTMFVDTQSGSMDAINTETGFSHDVFESGTMTLFTEDGSIDYAGTLNAISGRGYSSWMNPKKPYNITFSKKADLLGMGAAKKWVLISNLLDVTNLRNKIIYDFAGQIGLTTSPQCELVDLYLNGEYAGLYLLSEKVEIDEERVNISNSDGDITGGYLFGMQLPGRLSTLKNAFQTENGQVFEVKGNCNEERLAYLSRTVQGLENAILAEDGMDPDTGKSWLDYIDLDSWVKKYLIEEVFENQDADAASQFFYKDADSVDPKIYAGPIWDYDYALGNGDRSVHNPNCFIARRLWKKEGVYTPWYGALYEKEIFFNRMTEIYETQFLPLLQELVDGKIEEMAAEIAPATTMNRLRWDSWLSRYGDLQISERSAAAMRNFLSQRVNFLNSAWIDGVDYCTVCLDESDGTEYLYYTVVRGQYFEDLIEYEDTEMRHFLGWYDAESNQLFDPTQPITQDISLYAKWETLEDAAKPAADAAAADDEAETAEETAPDRFLSRSTFKKLLYAAPVALMGLLLVIFLSIDVRRNHGNRRDEN